MIWHKVVWIEVDWYNEYEIKDYENDFRFNVSPNSTDDTTAHVWKDGVTDILRFVFVIQSTNNE